MQVFMTGASGFIGSALVTELIGAGHEVLALARSDAGAAALEAAGAEVHRGDLADLDAVLSGASLADAVIHTAFDHELSKFVANCEADRRLIEAIGTFFQGSKRPFIVTSATGVANTVPGRPALERNPVAKSVSWPRAASDEAAASIAGRGLNVSVIRLPQVHDHQRQGLITNLIHLARDKGVSAYVDEGLNRWPATHLSDAARLYRLALESGDGGDVYHAVAEEGVRFRDIAEVIGQGLKVPVISLLAADAIAHFGWLAPFARRDLPASSALTQERLGWSPTGPGLIADLERATQT